MHAVRCATVVCGRHVYTGGHWRRRRPCGTSAENTAAQKDGDELWLFTIVQEAALLLRFPKLSPPDFSAENASPICASQGP